MPDCGHPATDPFLQGCETNTTHTGRENTSELLLRLDLTSSTFLHPVARRCHHHPSPRKLETSTYHGPGMCSTPHARLKGRESTRLGRSVSLLSRSPSLPSLVLSTPRNSLPMSKRRGARLRHHGLSLTKWRRMPTHKGLNMSDGQYAQPGETTKEKSHALETDVATKESLCGAQVARGRYLIVYAWPSTIPPTRHRQ